MTDLPFMRIWWGDFFGDGKVAALDAEARGVYLLLLGAMWLNGGWLPNSDAVISKALGMHHHTWRLRYKPVILPLLTQGVTGGVTPLVTGGVLTQKRLTKELGYATGKLNDNKLLLAGARAAKAEKAKQRPKAAEPETVSAADVATGGVKALTADLTIPDTHIKGRQAASQPSAAGPAATVAVGSLRPMPGDVEPSDPALVGRLVSDGLKRGGGDSLFEALKRATGKD